MISKHLNRIFRDGELGRGATVAKNATVQVEAGREVKRDVEYFKLDAIVSVGYKVLKSVMNSNMRDNTELFKQYTDNEDFKRWMADAIFKIVYHSAGRP